MAPAQNGIEVVGTGGLEPPTSCVSSRRSNQLSYAPKTGKDGPYRRRQYSNGRERASTRIWPAGCRGGAADGREPEAGGAPEGGRRIRHARTYLIGVFRALPAVKRTTRRFGILTAAPVCGLRAVRAFRSQVLKVPKPTKVMAHSSSATS